MLKHFSTWACAALLSALTLGCQHLPPRINHIHDEANQQIAEKNLAIFNEYTSEATGLPATLLKNLSAETALARTAAKKDLETAERGLIFRTLDHTWEELRTNFFATVGLTPAPPNQAEMTNALYQNISGPLLSTDLLHEKFKDGLEERLTDVNVVCSALKVMVDLRTKIVETEAEKLRVATEALAGKSSSANPANNLSGLEAALKGIEQDISEAYKETAGRLANRIRLLPQARALADMIDKARQDNPVMLKALVPVVGAGLDTNSTALLHEFSTNLAARAARWGSSVAKPYASKKPLESGTNLQRTNGDMEQANASKLWIKSLEKLSKSQGEKTNFFLYISGRVNSKEPSNLVSNANWFSKAIHEFPLALQSLANATRGLVANLDAYDKELGKFQSRDDTTEVVIQNFGGSFSNILSAVLPGYETIKVGTNLLGNLIADFIKDQQSAKLPLAELISKIGRAQVDFHQEMLRHDQGVLMVGQREARRWLEVGRAWTNVQEIFLNRTNLTILLKPLLFQTDASNSLWKGFISHSHLTNDVPKGLIPSDINITHNILATLRLLGESASIWQAQSPSFRDPEAIGTQFANVRMTQAVTLIQRFLFLMSYNRREANENAILLGAEATEHDIHLQNLRFGLDEFTIGYELKNLLAFHQGGLTATDMQNALNLVQSGLLTWIGIQQ